MTNRAPARACARPRLRTRQARRGGLPTSTGIRCSEQTIDLRAALSSCARVIRHAGPASVARALLAGVPCLLLPLQAEQYLLARQVERCGAAVNAASLARPVDYPGVIGAMLVTGAGAAAASQAMARRYQGYQPKARMEEVALAAERLVAGEVLERRAPAAPSAPSAPRAT